LWKWIDTRGKKFGVGRPYLDRDPPHVAPIDGKEYADHRGRANRRYAESKTRTRQQLSRHNNGVAKHATTARVSKAIGNTGEDVAAFDRVEAAR
jgi:hypothetical protein